MHTPKAFIFANVLLLSLTGCSSFWETSPLGRKLRHIGDPTVGQIGGMPIYLSDALAVYTMLPKESHDSIKNDKNTLLLASTVTDEYSWRKAAIEKGAFASPDFALRMTHAENEVYKNWLMAHRPDFSATDAEIKQFIAQNPAYFETRHYFTYRTDRYKKRTRKFLSTHEQAATYTRGAVASPELSIVARLPIGKKSAWFPCGADLCRYTLIQDIPQPGMDPKTSQVMISQMIIQTKTLEWLRKYQEMQHVSISTASLSGIINSD